MKHDVVHSFGWLHLEWLHWSALTHLCLDGQFVPVFGARLLGLSRLQTCKLSLGHDDEVADDRSLSRADTAVVSTIRNCDTSTLVSLVIGWPCSTIFSALLDCTSLTYLAFLSPFRGARHEVESLPQLRSLRRLSMLRLPLMDGHSLPSLLLWLPGSLCRLTLSAEADVPVSLSDFAAWPHQLEAPATFDGGSMWSIAASRRVLEASCSIDLRYVPRLPDVLRNLWPTCASLAVALTTLSQ